MVRRCEGLWYDVEDPWYDVVGSLWYDVVGSLWYDVVGSLWYDVVRTHGTML